MKLRSAAAAALAACALLAAPLAARQISPGAGAIVVLDTDRGTIEFETYPDEAPKTVARVVELVKEHFYDGQRFHRSEPGFLIQIGDPQTRDMTKREWWGRSASGKPIGVAEITKKRRNVRGAVAMAYPGTDARTADSQFYILLSAHPELDARYTVFGKVIAGIEVADRVQVGDMVRKAYLRE